MQHMGVSKNRGTRKWMVYNGKPYKNGWFGGTPIFGNIHINIKEIGCFLVVHPADVGCTNPAESSLIAVVHLFMQELSHKKMPQPNFLWPTI